MLWPAYRAFTAAGFTVLQIEGELRALLCFCLEMELLNEMTHIAIQLSSYPHDLSCIGLGIYRDIWGYIGIWDICTGICNSHFTTPNSH